MSKVSRIDDRTTKAAVYAVTSKDGTPLGGFNVDYAVKPLTWTAAKPDGSVTTFEGNGGNSKCIAWLEGRPAPEPKAETPKVAKKAQPAKAKAKAAKKPAQVAKAA